MRRGGHWQEADRRLNGPPAAHPAAKTLSDAHLMSIYKIHLWGRTGQGCEGQRDRATQVMAVQGKVKQGGAGQGRAGQGRASV